MDGTRRTTENRRLRALVLDDDPAAVRDVRHALARRFSTLSAGDGISGLQLLLEELLELDVVVTDIDLPHRDARSLAHVVRRAGGEQDLAIVVLAKNAPPETRAELLAMGVDAVVDRDAGADALADAALAAVAARNPGDRTAAPMFTAAPAPAGRRPPFAVELELTAA